jgi:hypothetical protein
MQMKVMIVSDTHRKHKNLKMALDRMSPIDLLIHLGDAEGYEEYIAELAKCPIEIVAGNNDFFSRLDYEKVITVGKYKVFLTHGHYYYVEAGVRDLVKAGKAKEVDIIMYGHTHRPVLEHVDGMTVLNPGSLTHPRQEGRQPSFIMMETDREGEAHFTVHYL